ncbi:growth-regulated alpha protein-like [Phocoena phocoena]|uniref:growth-regulated alpha protein-like n=2 Tax=Phocoena phocoena TaxID=9742 RepID=UPI003307C5F5
MARAATPAAARLLSAALLLLVLVAAGRRAAGAPVVTELRCQCLQTVQGIHLKNIQSVKVTPPGPHCGQTEVVATLKTGQEVCLNPEAPMVKKIINKMLNKGPSAPPPALTRLLAPPVRGALGNPRLEGLALPPSPVGAEPGLQLRGPERREVAPLF